MATKIISTKQLLKQFNSPTVDQVGVVERASRFSTRSIKKEAKIQGLKMALNMIDLTTLEGMDTEGKVRQMCYKAIHLHDSYSELPTVAAVCVYPTLVKVAKRSLGNSGVKVASVASAFPSGLATLRSRVSEVKYAVNEGADEVDMVISRGRFHQGDYNFVYDEIAQVKEACGKARLKVILETGELGTFDKVRNEAYARALGKVVGPQTTVIDLGAGLGVHGLNAACLGAGADESGPVH